MGFWNFSFHFSKILTTPEIVCWYTVNWIRATQPSQTSLFIFQLCVVILLQAWSLYFQITTWTMSSRDNNQQSVPASPSPSPSRSRSPRARSRARSVSTSSSQSVRSQNLSFPCRNGCGTLLNRDDSRLRHERICHLSVSEI